MSLLIHATLAVSGDSALLAELRERLNAALAQDYAELSYTETHGDSALHYDMKTASGIPFPALIDCSQHFPDLVLSMRWVNAEAGTQATVRLKAGRIETQATDPLDVHSAGRQPGYVAARADGTLALACAIFSVRSDGCAGYVVNGLRDALFAIRLQDDRATLCLSEGDTTAWETCRQFDLATGVGDELPESAGAPIDATDYVKWRQYAEAFVADWLWLDDDAPELTAIERQRFAEQGIPIRPANLRYAKLKALRERDPSSSGIHAFDHLTDDLRYTLRVLDVGFD